MSNNRWTDKEDVAHIYTMKYYSAIIKEQNNATCSNMDATTVYHTKWSKSKRDRQTPYDITYMWNLNYDPDEPIYETEKESQTWRKD